MVGIKSKIPTSQAVYARLARLQPWYVLIRYQNRLTKSLFAFVNACISILIVSVAAVMMEQPLIFPTLGPISFLCFSSPSAAASSPRNVILSHSLGVLIGWLTLAAATQMLGTGGMATQIVAVTISLGLISAVMIFADIPHPPAAATTLLVSLGLMSEWTECAVLLVAVVALTAQAFIINRLSGVYYPLWKVPAWQATDSIVTTALATSTVYNRSTADRLAEAANQLVTRQRVERRRSPRIPVPIDSGLKSRIWTPNGQDWPSLPINLSLYGIMIETATEAAPHLKPGTCIEIELTLGEHLMRIKGVVKRRQEARYGVGFIESTQAEYTAARKTLRSILRALQS